MSEEIKPYNASHDSPAAAAASQVNELEPSKQVTGVDQGIASPTGTTKQVDNSKTAKKPAAATAPTTVESVVAAAKRYIPGLNREPSETNKPKRNRNKKAGGAGSREVKSAEDPALATATLESAPDKSDLPDNLTVNGGGAGHGTGKRPAALNGTSNSITAEEQAVLDHKRFSPAALVQKRLKANGKKLQRITGYENQTETLNADQKKAVASKPALDAVQRELSELVKVFETEEADDDKKVEKKKQYEDKQVQIKLNQAVSNANIHTQNDLTLLLQFLHLYSCFNPSQAFAPPTLPPVVANATAQQHAAVHSLFHNLANGPLFGGASSSSDSGDAIEQIKALQEGSNKDVIEGVSFADVKQMILDLTAPPNELEGASHEIPESSASAAGQLPGEDQQPPLAAAENGATGAGGAPSFNFMQASELSNGAQQSQEGNGVPLSPPNADDDAQHERALESHSIPATPGFGSAVGGQNSGVQTPNVVEPQMLADGGKTADGASGWEAPSSLLPNGAGATGAGWGDDTAPGSEPIKSWADDVDDANPINPFTTTAEVPSELSGTKPAGDDGFQSVGNDNAGSRGRGGRGGGYRGRGEGQPRGEGRGRGGGRGGERGSGRGGRGDGSMQWRRSDAPNADAATQAIRAAEGAGEVAPGAAGTVEGEARRGGGGGYRGRGGRGNGGEGGRGSYRGSRGGDGEGRGSYRGRGEGRGEGRGGYRGGRGGAANAGATSAPVAAAAAPAQ